MRVFFSGLLLMVLLAPTVSYSFFLPNVHTDPAVHTKLNRAIEQKKAAQEAFNTNLVSQAKTVSTGIGKSGIVPPDVDKDGVPDHEDNCPFNFNPSQVNDDQHIEGAIADDQGNHCDPDMDGDGVFNQNDEDRDGDGVEERIDLLFDNEGLSFEENRRLISLATEPCRGGDALRLNPIRGATCYDNDPYHYNPGQEDYDLDGVGDLYEYLTDEETVHLFEFRADGCYDQQSWDTWHFGERFRVMLDSDGDGYTAPRVDNIFDPDGVVLAFGDELHQMRETLSCDNCPAVFNHDQADTNQDGIGDACQIPFERVADWKMFGNPEMVTEWLPDPDGDRVPNLVIQNPEIVAQFQRLGIVERCTSGKGREGTASFGTCYDNAPIANANQLDTDGDGWGDVSDDCPRNAAFHEFREFPGLVCPEPAQQVIHIPNSFPRW